MISKRTVISLSLPLFLAIAACSSVNQVSVGQNQPSKENSAPLAVAQANFSYQDYAQVLQTYVDDRGLVNYSGLQTNRAQLDRFVQAMGAVPQAVYQSWSEPKRLAFLINAYNAFTLQSIIDQNPLKSSIRRIPGVWKRRKFLVAGEQKTLDNIEHATIRKEFNEPRIHAALVCAAISCPPLLNEPYTEDKLEEQLEDRSARWINGKHGLAIDHNSNTVAISAIFKWFGEDWLEQYQTEQFKGNAKERATLNFASQYLKPENSQYLKQGNYKVKYLDYDWSLNKQ